MHDGGDDVLLAVKLLCEPIGFFIESAGVFVPAVLLKVFRVHVEDHLVKDLGVGLESAKRNLALIDKLIQIFVIRQISAALERDIHGRAGEIDVHVFIGFVFPFDVSLKLAD